MYKAPRWKEPNDDRNEDTSNLNGKKNSKKVSEIPQKNLIYFPLMSHLQMLFMSSKMVDAKINAERMVSYVVPIDAKAWKALDTRYPSFAKDPRNIRLRLASTDSTWPVNLMPYNLLVWLCMKNEYFIISLLIRRLQAIGNNTDLYL